MGRDGSSDFMPIDGISVSVAILTLVGLADSCLPVQVCLHNGSAYQSLSECLLRGNVLTSLDILHGSKCLLAYL